MTHRLGKRAGIGDAARSSGTAISASSTTSGSPASPWNGSRNSTVRCTAIGCELAQKNRAPHATFSGTRNDSDPSQQNHVHGFTLLILE